MTAPIHESAAPAPTPVPGTLSLPDHRSITVWQWPRKRGRPLLHWAHATGFHARTYMPLLNRLAESANLIAWDMRGHGASAGASVTGHRLSWQIYYRDLAALIDAQDEPVWLAGHSIGATASAMAAAQRSGAVRGLLLVEPVLLDRRERMVLAASKALRQAHRLPMAAGARRRRAEFPDRTAAFENYRGKRAFRSWPDDWLAAYVEHGFVDTPTGVRLACDPAWECATFAATEHKPWSTLARLGCPLVALGADHGSTFPPTARHRMSRLLPQARLEAIDGTSHFLPMERPQAVVDGWQTLLDDASGRHPL